MADGLLLLTINDRCRLICGVCARIAIELMIGDGKCECCTIGVCDCGILLGILDFFVIIMRFGLKINFI